MAEGENRYWFAAKRYGWGWGLPLCWQGWLVMACWLGVLAAAIAWVEEPSRSVVVLVASVALVAVCWWKGEPARWRWGGD